MMSRIPRMVVKGEDAIHPVCKNPKQIKNPNDQILKTPKSGGKLKHKMFQSSRFWLFENLNLFWTSNFEFLYIM